MVGEQGAYRENDAEYVQPLGHAHVPRTVLLQAQLQQDRGQSDCSQNHSSYRAMERGTSRVQNDQGNRKK